jgi:peptide/nickel transport system substrate-binding protein
MSDQLSRSRHPSRRKFLRTVGVGVSATVLAQVLAGCAAPAAPTAAPTAAAPAAAKPTAAPAAAPAAAAPTAAPAAAAPTAAPAAAAKPAASTPAAAAKPAATGGHITMANFADAQIMNPVLYNDQPSSWMVKLIFDALVNIDPPDGKVRGELAESWKVSEDGLTYTFALRKGVKWHDGKDFTAEDVKFTFDSIFDTEINSPIRSTTVNALGSAEAILVKDPHTVEFKLPKPYAPFLVQDFMTRGILPKHLLGDKKGKDFNTADFNTKAPVGTGPFKFKEWVKDSYVTLEANSNYHMGKPKIDQFVYKVVKDSTAVAAQLKTGEADWGQFEPPTLEELKKVPHLDVKAFDEFNFTFYGYQLDKTRTELFQEKAVRQALFLALDRKAMLDAILFGQGAVADSVYPVISWARDPKDNPKYDYDPARAKKMLDDAGWKPGAGGIREKNGKKLSFTIYTNAGNKPREALVAVMQEQWKEIGVEATPKTEEFTAFVNRIQNTKEFEVFLVGFSWTPDPDQTAMWATASQKGGFNIGAYSNPRVDQLLADGLKETSQEKRKAIYKEIDKIVMDDLPSPALFFTKRLMGLNKRVQNLDPNAFDHFYNSHLWSVTDGR